MVGKTKAFYTKNDMKTLQKNHQQNKGMRIGKKSLRS